MLSSSQYLAVVFLHLNERRKEAVLAGDEVWISVSFVMLSGCELRTLAEYSRLLVYAKRL